MKGHFRFIEQQVDQKNMFLAVPMSPSGGQYWFDGQLSEEEINQLLADEPSIGTVFSKELKRAYVPKHNLVFIMESHKRAFAMSEAANLSGSKDE